LMLSLDFVGVTLDASALFRTQVFLYADVLL